MQARSRARYDAILEAAAELFAEVGFEAATMDQVAEQAGTSVGSIYQFFSNKRDIYRALAERCLERSDQAFGTFLEGFDPDSPWDEIVELTVDGFGTLLSADHAYRAILVNFHLYGEFVEADQAMLARFVDTLVVLLRSRNAELDEAKAKRVMTVAVTAVSFLLFTALRRPEDEAAGILAETKDMVRRYIEPLMNG